MIQINRFIALDSMRGICAIFVALYHLHIPYSVATLDFIRNCRGFIEFFFVLSGFVLFHVYGNILHNYRDFNSFIIKRFSRLYPLHLFMLAVFIVFECGKVLAEKAGFHLGTLPFSGSNALKEILPNLLLIQAWLNPISSSSFNFPSWSISTEFYIYIIFASILILNRKSNLYFFASIAAFSFIALIKDFHILSTNIFFAFSSFFTGIFSYLIYMKVKKNSFTKNFLSILEGLSILILVMLVNSNIEHKSIATTLFFCIIIVIFALEGGYISSILKHKFFMTLGKLSYSIYMLHAAVIFFIMTIAIVCSRLFHHNFAPMLPETKTGQLIRYISTGTSIGNNILVFMTLSILVVLAHFSWKYIEVPGLNWTKTFLLNKKTRIAAPT